MEKLYSRHQEEEYFQELNHEMTSGPSLVLRLQKENALADYRKLVGPMIDAKENAPDSLRAKYQVGEVNPIHAASNQSQVKLEKELFFSDSATKSLPVSYCISVRKNKLLSLGRNPDRNRKCPTRRNSRICRIIILPFSFSQLPTTIHNYLFFIINIYFFKVFIFFPF